MYIVELNLDDDFTSPFAYHIAEVEETIKNNIYCALNKRKLNNWVIVGLAETHEEAREISARVKLDLCEKSGKEFQESQFGI